VARTLCPKHPPSARIRGYRVYAETISTVTGRSTKVPLPAIFCGILTETQIGGRTVGAFRIPRGSHGIVPMDPQRFAVQRRASVVATGKAHPRWGRKAAAKAKGRGRAKPRPRARKPAAGPARPVSEGVSAGSSP